MDITTTNNLSRRPWHTVSPLVVLFVVLWAYWTALAGLCQRWLHDARYSHGLLVPLMALLVWWVRRRDYPVANLQPSGWGLPVLVSGMILRLVGAYYYLDWFDGLSLLPALLGLVLLVGGWPLAWQMGPAIAVLFFMLPLPFQVEGALSA